MPNKEGNTTKELYIMCDNFTNYVILREFTRGDDDAAIIDWDMSDTELRQMLNGFDDGKNVGIPPKSRIWRPFKVIKGWMNTCQTLAEYLDD